MFKKIFTIIVIIIVIIEIQNVNGFNGHRFKRNIKKVAPNCKILDHLGRCADIISPQTLDQNFNKQNVKPKAYLKRVQ